MPESGFREIEHTADRELLVWAPDLSGLLEQAARGMYHLVGARLLDDRRETRRLTIPYADPESLLVAFLTELLYFSETESIGFDRYWLKLDGRILHAVLEGAPLAPLAVEIKAVTYHNLRVTQVENGLQVNIVFDV